MVMVIDIVHVWMLLKTKSFQHSAFLVDLVHCLRDPQVLFLAKTILKLGSTALFTHLKIILL